MFNNDIIYYLQVGRVKPRGSYINDPTGYILSDITEGLFVIVLEDDNGGNAYSIGINRGSSVIYTCMETHEIQFNRENLSK